jgi:hypothetical protein
MGINLYRSENIKYIITKEIEAEITFAKIVLLKNCK